MSYSFENYHYIDVLAKLSLLASAKRKIEIVSEPSGKGHMPSVPEIFDTHRKVRCVEVITDLDSHYTCCTNCYIGVSRKIAIDLNREKYSCDCKLETVEGRIFTDVKDVINGNCKSVCDDHLEEISVEHCIDALDQIFSVHEIFVIKTS